MAMHCNVLAWNIPWTEERGRLQVQNAAELDGTEHEPDGMLDLV